jgi:hypothetical protein
MRNGSAGPFLEMSSELQTAPSSKRSEVVNALMSRLMATGVITRWYSELFPVSQDFGEEPLFLLERAAYNILGIKGWL